MDQRFSCSRPISYRPQTIQPIHLAQLSQLGDETVILKNFPLRIVSLPHKTV
jgi:hypothetical protein